MQRISMDSNEVGVEDTTVDTGQSGGARHLIIDDAPRLFRSWLLHCLACSVMDKGFLA